jgi:hypothetical protein
MKKRIRSALLVLILELFIAFVCPPVLPAGSSGSTTAEIGPGTVISQQNWQQYRNFMSEGLAALFQGDHFWHLLHPFQSHRWGGGSCGALTLSHCGDYLPLQKAIAIRGA